MRRMLIGVALVLIALAASIYWSRPGTLPVSYLPRIAVTLFSQPLVDPSEFDRGISAMECRIVATEWVDGDRFLLTEVCAWKGGRVERRRFLAFRKGDGPTQGWMYHLTESDT